MYDRSRIQDDFGNAASVYDEKAILQKQVLLDTMQQAATRWPENGLIADIGSGTGMLNRLAAEYNHTWQIRGCDLAFGMCQHASSMGYVTTVGDAQALPFASNVFDGVFSSLMMQWALDPVGVFKEMYRILKGDSYAVITTFTQGTLKELQQAFKAVDDKPHTSHFRNMMEWGADVQSAGFAIKQMQEKTHMEYYPDTRALTQNLKAIGAKHKPKDGNQAKLTKAQFAQLEDAYQAQFRTDKGIAVTWKVLTLVLYKA